MTARARHLRTALTLLVAFLSGAAIFVSVALNRRVSAPPAHMFGVTFSKKYASELGLDWRKAYLAMLDDLGARKLRIPVYWDEVEKTRGKYDWADVDWMLAQASERDIEVTLAIGRKVPRWPECHAPVWAKRLSRAAQDERVLMLLEAEVRRFKSSAAVVRWQVENEPLFRFGACPPPDRKLLKKEIETVRALDRRPILLTDSGELSFWHPTASFADVLGISLYRTVWNKYLGFWFWPLSPAWYAERIALIKPFVRGKRVIISELQAEPWFSKPFPETPIEEQLSVMSLKRFRSNVAFARQTGVSEAYLWGVEWWYWLKMQGRPEFWSEAKKLFSW